MEEKPPLSNEQAIEELTRMFLQIGYTQPDAEARACILALCGVIGGITNALEALSISSPDQPGIAEVVENARSSSAAAANLIFRGHHGPKP